MSHDNIKLTEHTAYMSRDVKDSLIEILYDVQVLASGSYFEIFWYHWPSDGIFPWHDYEPVVFAYNSIQELCFVMVRRGWKIIITNPDEIYSPPEVLFKSASHHQFIRMRTDDLGDFDQSNLGRLSALEVTYTNVRPVNSSNPIPDWNISGLGGNIYEKIKAAMSESCQ